MVYSCIFYIIWKWIIKVRSCRVITKTKALVRKKIVTPEALLIYHWCIFLFTKANFHSSISGDRSVFCDRFFIIGMRVDWKIEKYDDRWKLVNRSKNLKHFQLFNRSPVFQPIKFLQLHYSHFYYLIKQSLSGNCNGFQGSKNYPLPKVDRKNVINLPKYLNGNQVLHVPCKTITCTNFTVNRIISRFSRKINQILTVKLPAKFLGLAKLCEEDMISEFASESMKLFFFHKAQAVLKIAQNVQMQLTPVGYSEPCQTSKMELFEKIFPS